jgi:chemotaxis-related protein WspD
MGEVAGTTSDRRNIIKDCWNKIGVRGDRSCVELEQHVHCRNCPTYSAAALTLLDRDLPAGYLSEWTAHFAGRKALDEPDIHSAIIFRIASEWFAFPTLALDEVVEPRTIHSLPHLRSSVVLGLVNVRGELLICVSLAKMLRLGETTSVDAKHKGIDSKRLVVIRHSGGRVAFPTDEVQSIHRYHPRELKSVPATIAKASAAYINALLPLQGKTVGCLDDQLLTQALDRIVA